MAKVKTFALGLPGPLFALAIVVGTLLTLPVIGAMLALPLSLLDGDTRTAKLAFAALMLTWLFAVVGDRLIHFGSVRVGSDGIAVEQRKQSRFVPWRSVVEVRSKKGRRKITLVLDDGSTVVLHSPVASKLINSIRRGLERSRGATQRQTPHFRVLEPKDEHLSEWMDRVRDAARPGNYRVDAPPEEALLAVVEDPDENPTHRVGAALALSETGKENRLRLRVAAEETAEPSLARALSEAADGELKLETLRRVVKS